MSIHLDKTKIMGSMNVKGFKTNFFLKWEKFIQVSSTYFYRYDLPAISDQKIKNAYKLY